MDLVTKPFIVCYADGYFVDCYGPFEANKNDKNKMKNENNFIYIYKIYICV